MSASRLKGKPLLEINNLPIICHVVKIAKETAFDLDSLKFLFHDLML